MEHLTVTPAELRGHATALAGIGSGLQPQFTLLTRTADRLLGGSWTGGAAAGFQRGWAEWYRGALAALGALQTLSLLVEEAAGRYDGTETAAAVVQQP